MSCSPVVVTRERERRFGYQREAVCTCSGTHDIIRIETLQMNRSVQSYVLILKSVTLLTKFRPVLMYTQHTHIGRSCVYLPPSLWCCCCVSRSSSSSCPTPTLSRVSLKRKIHLLGKRRAVNQTVFSLSLDKQRRRPMHPNSFP